LLDIKKIAAIKNYMSEELQQVQVLILYTDQELFSTPQHVGDCSNFTFFQREFLGVGDCLRGQVVQNGTPDVGQGVLKDDQKLPDVICVLPSSSCC
jgi:hypothetical protein